MARQYVFPSNRLSKDPRSGVLRRHHLHESSLQKAVRKAAKLAGIDKEETLEAWGERDGNQYPQYDAQPEEQKREALYTSRFAFRQAVKSSLDDSL